MYVNIFAEFGAVGYVVIVGSIVLYGFWYVNSKLKGKDK